MSRLPTNSARGWRFIAAVTTHSGAASRASGTVDTLQLVAEQPSQRATETLLEAPEFNRGGAGPRMLWLWTAVTLAGAGAIAWWLLN